MTLLPLKTSCYAPDLDEKKKKKKKKKTFCVVN